MAINRLQLTLIAENHPLVQALPVEIREVSIEFVARMLLVLVRGERVSGTSKEARDEISLISTA
jgi:hypothetical protein